MVLSDNDIARELGYGELHVSPINPNEQIQPSSLDIRIGDEIGRYNSSNLIIDSQHTDVERHLLTTPLFEGETFMVEPDDFVLCNTEEYISLPDDLCAVVKGRSSFGRLGLEIHSTAGLCDPGFEGKIVLELSSNADHDIRLHRGDRIAQLVFMRLDSPAEVPYGEKENKYQGQQGAVGSRIWEEHHDG